MITQKYVHSFVKAWLHYLGNKIYINGTDYFEANDYQIKSFDISPLNTYLNYGRDLLTEKELAEISTLSFNDMKKKFGLTVYRVRSGDKKWRTGQKYILFISKIRRGMPDEIPEATFRIRNLKLEWDKLNQCIRGVGEDFGTIDGQYSTGDTTPWIYYGEEKRKMTPLSAVKHDNYSEITDLLLNKWEGKKLRPGRKIAVKELPVMITEEGELLCFPKTRVLPKILIVGKCQPAGSKVLMANGDWKNIEDVKVGDMVLSPQNKSSYINSKVISVCSYYSIDNYAVVQMDKVLYRCTGTHQIPVLVGTRLMDIEARNLLGRKFNTPQTILYNNINASVLKDADAQVYGFTIDSPSQYYITDNWMVTHNSGKGKSWALSSLLGRAFYIYEDRVGLLNDSLNQFYELMLPMDSDGFIHELGRVGNEPKPLPVINLYMSCPNVNMKFADENVSYRLVIDFKDFLYRYRFFTHGVAKWDLGKPEKYFTKDVVNELNVCSNAEDVKDALFRIFPNANADEGMQKMIFKWVAALESIFRDQFTYNLFRTEPTTSPSWKLVTPSETLSGHPFIISMEAGIVPIVNNYLAKGKPIAKKQMTDLLKKIVDWQMIRDEKKHRIWIGVDELKDFLGKKNDELYEALDYIFTQGRINNIGFVGNVQEYTKLSSAMRANSSHLIIFELQTNEERSAIAKDYMLDKDKLSSIADLKTFQCLLTTKEKVVIYSKSSSRKEVEGGIWRGRILPPITTHKSP